jgi:type II restriction/modification system DNA methylase subunit YeeA
VLDPACGSGHFLLYAFDLLLAIYEEAYADSESPKSEATGKALAEDYPSLEAR